MFFCGHDRTFQIVSSVKTNTCSSLLYDIFFFFSPNEQRAGGGALPDFFFFFFPCSADHERDWPPCKVVFFGLATNALNVRNNNNHHY